MGGRRDTRKEEDISLSSIFLNIHEVYHIIHAPCNSDFFEVARKPFFIFGVSSKDIALMNLVKLKDRFERLSRKR